MIFRFWCVLTLLSLARLASADTPQWQWAQALSVRPAAIATDALGNSYVIGGFAGTAQVGGTTLVSGPLHPGDTDAFLAKFNANGRLQWVTRFGGPWASVTPTALALDGAGNCYFTGRVRGTVQYGPGQTLTGSAQWPGVLVGRCNARGQVSWLRRDGSNDYASLGGAAIAADAAGNCYVVGAVTTPLLPGAPPTDALRYQFFVASYSATAAVRWTAVAQSPTMFNGGQGLALDQQGNCYVSGYYTGQLALGGTTLSAPGPMGFCGRLRQHDGGLVWLQNLGAGVSPLSTLAADARGLLLAGRYQGATSFQGYSLAGSGGEDAFLARFTPGGQPQWVRALPATPGDDAPAAVRCDATGTGYVLLNHADATRGSSGAVVNNLTLATVSAAGTPGWSTTAAGMPELSGLGCALDAQFRLYVVGTYAGPAQLGPHRLGSGAGPGFLARVFGGFPGDESASAARGAAAAVFPNPVSAGYCTVRTPAASTAHPVQLRLLDRFGQEVRRQQLTAPDNRLATDGLPPGPYVLQLSSAGQASSQPLLVAP